MMRNCTLVAPGSQHLQLAIRHSTGTWNCTGHAVGFKTFMFCSFHCAALGLDNEQPDYDMDSEDETLLNRLNRKMEIKPLQFEKMVDRLEKASTNQVHLAALFLASVFAH